MSVPVAAHVRRDDGADGGRGRPHGPVVAHAAGALLGARLERGEHGAGHGRRAEVGQEERVVHGD